MKKNKNDNQLSDNPYTNGKREWMERYGSYISAMKMWRGVALACLLVTAVSVYGVITLAQKSEFVPYVVEIDKLGRVGAVNYPTEGYTPEIKHIQSDLANWVEHTRSVWADGFASKRSVEKSFSHINKSDPSFIFLSEFSKTNWKRAMDETVSIEVLGEPLKITSKTWQVEWRERVVTRGGEPLRDEIWRGNFEVYIATPKTQKLLLNNPLGVNIKTISWSRQKSLAPNQKATNE